MDHILQAGRDIRREKGAMVMKSITISELKTSVDAMAIAEVRVIRLEEIRDYVVVAVTKCGKQVKVVPNNQVSSWSTVVSVLQELESAGVKCMSVSL